MVRRKNIRTRGKISFSNYFRKFNAGDSVAIVMERSIVNNLPKRIQGKTGKIKEKRGKFYIVNLKDQNKMKEFLVAPVHLKKIEEKK
jgi:ribosomal protein L21E